MNREIVVIPNISTTEHTDVAWLCCSMPTLVNE